MSALTIICIILSAIMLIINLLKGEFAWALFWTVLLSLNIYVGRLDVKEKKESAKYGDDVTETRVIKDVKGFSADTITIINGADTTKTYVLTYWK